MGQVTNDRLVQILGRKVELSLLSDAELNEMHEKLINTILTEEESLINSHRSHVDKMYEFSA